MVTTPEAKALRVEAGKYLKELRKSLSLNQKELADKVGIEFFTFVSQVEIGAAQMPPGLLKKWADALKIDHKEFATELLKYYQPEYFEMIFGGKARRKPS